MIENENLNEPQTPQLNIGAVSGLLLNEIIFLLRKSQPNSCYEWKEGIGDCGKLECPFCRIKKCIDALEGNDC